MAGTPQWRIYWIKSGSWETAGHCDHCDQLTTPTLTNNVVPWCAKSHWNNLQGYRLSVYVRVAHPHSAVSDWTGRSPSSAALTLTASQGAMTGTALLPGRPLDGRCEHFLHRETGGEGRGPAPGAGWRGGGGVREMMNYPSPPPTRSLPSSFSISVYQCLVEVKPGRSRAAQRSPHCQQSVERPHGPAGPSHLNHHSTSLHQQHGPY